MSDRLGLTALGTGYITPRRLHTNALSISFPFYTNSAGAGIDSLMATPSILQLDLGQPFLTSEGTKSSASFATSPGASVYVKCLTVLGATS